MPKRRHLNSSFTEYPAIVVQRWTGGVFFKFFMCGLISAAWCGIFYVFLGIYNFLNENILMRPPVDIHELYRAQSSFYIMSVGIILVTIYVFTSSRRHKQK